MFVGGLRAYIREVHLPVIQALLVGLGTFQTVVGVYWDGYTQVDGDSGFRLVDDEFTAHLAQLDEGIFQLRGFADQLRSIGAGAAHLVDLGGAGASEVDQVVRGFEDMRRVVRDQQETWSAYEVTDHGFNQVRELIVELKGELARVGTVQVGRGVAYVPGSFDLGASRVGELVSSMARYCQVNQQVAQGAWDQMLGCYAVLAPGLVQSSVGPRS